MVLSMLILLQICLRFVMTHHVVISSDNCEADGSTWRYPDDLFNIDNPQVSQIYWTTEEFYTFR